MKLCRFQPLVFAADALGAAQHPAPAFGRIEGDAVRELSGDIFSERRESGRCWPLNQVKLLPPVTPSKIVCIGRNYREHAAELGHDVPKYPLIFLKAPSAIIGPDEPIVLTPDSQRVDYEGELAAVIGRACSKIAAAEFAPCVLGYTCLNDVTARDLQKLDVQFTRAKSFDTFCPLGPFIETELDLRAATVETYVNGQRRQQAPVTEMIFPIGAIISWISRVMTLEPGDVIATGTPAGVGPLHAGEVVEVVVSGIGTLRNPVVAAEM